VAEMFLTLPDREQYPNYYDLIQKPISIREMEEKLESDQYRSLEELEADFTQMVINARL
jgi:hypothetical protein